MPCSFPGCERKLDSLGLCSPHRKRKLSGRPLIEIKPYLEGKTILFRFWAKVNKDGPIVRPELGPCWIWTAYRDRKGYGRFNAVNSRGIVLAHRFLWESIHGPINDPLRLVCHHCDNPPCVRDDHLFLGDHESNAADMVAKGRDRNKVSAGEANGSSRLTTEDVMEIRRRYVVGESSNSIAESFGIWPTTAWRIARGKSWAHIQDDISAPTVAEAIAASPGLGKPS